MISFFVAGAPITQSGMRAVPIGGGRMRQISIGGKGLAAWRQRIATEAQRAMGEAGPIEGPVSVAASFLLPRPASRPKRDLFPDRHPDVDKLARSVLDALSGIVFADDKQVCSLFVTKNYAPTRWGVEVVLYALTELGSRVQSPLPSAVTS